MFRTMRRPDILDWLGRNPNEKNATFNGALRLKHARALFFWATQRDGNRRQRRLIDAQARMGEGAESRRDIDQARLEQHARSCVSHRTLQADADCCVPEKLPMTGTIWQRSMDKLFHQHAQHIERIGEIGTDKNLIARIPPTLRNARFR